MALVHEALDLLTVVADYGVGGVSLDEGATALIVLGLAYAGLRYFVKKAPSVK